MTGFFGMFSRNTLRLLAILAGGQSFLSAERCRMESIRRHRKRLRSIASRDSAGGDAIDAQNDPAGLHFRRFHHDSVQVCFNMFFELWQAFKQ